MAPHTTEADASAGGVDEELAVEAGTLRHRHNAAKTTDDADGGEIKGSAPAGEEEDAEASVERAFEGKPVPTWREQLTVRAFVVSFFLAIMFSIIVMKLNLTTGIIPSLNVSAGLLGFFFVRLWTSAIERMGFLRQPFTRQENTVIQTCVVAAYDIAFSASQSSFSLHLANPIRSAPSAASPIAGFGWQPSCGDGRPVQHHFRPAGTSPLWEAAPDSCEVAPASMASPCRVGHRGGLAALNSGTAAASTGIGGTRPGKAGSVRGRVVPAGDGG